MTDTKNINLPRTNRYYSRSKSFLIRRNESGRRFDPCGSPVFNCLNLSKKTVVINEMCAIGRARETYAEWTKYFCKINFVKSIHICFAHLNLNGKISE